MQIVYSGGILHEMLNPVFRQKKKKKKKKKSEKKKIISLSSAALAKRVLRVFWYMYTINIQQKKKIEVSSFVDLYYHIYSSYWILFISLLYLY